MSLPPPDDNLPEPEIPAAKTLEGPLRLHLLGGFEAMLPGHHLVRISTRKNQALLAYLAAEPGRTVRREQLMDLLWSDRDRDHARDSLRQSLVGLRRDLAGIAPQPLVIEGNVLVLRVAAVEIDTLEFLKLARSDAVDDLRRCAELYRGEFLEGMAAKDRSFDAWLQAERTRFLAAAVDLFDRLVPMLSGRAAVDAAVRLVDLDPLREASSLTLIRLHAGQGDLDLAARHARRYRALLQRELKVVPSPAFDAEVATLVGAAPAPVAAPSPPAPAPAPTPAGPPDAGKIVVAVLPFENRTAGSDERHLADALTDNVITAISRAAAFRVVARSSTQTYVGQAGDFRKMALDLGADYVLEGGVQQLGDRARVNARLIDTRQGHHVWADRFECTVGDILDIENTLARGVTASIETQIYVSRRPTEDAAAPIQRTVRDLIMRARGLLYDMSAESFTEATRLAEEAIALEPQSPGAHLVLAETHLHQLSMGIIPHDPGTVAKGVELARTALQLDPEDEWAHSFMAKAYSEANRLPEAIAEAERALEINPSLSVAIARLGECYALLGESEKAIEHCRLALKLNPRNPTNFWRHSSIALAHFAAEDFEAVLHEARRVQAWRPDFLRGPILMAAALAALERQEEAVVAVAACLSLRPDLTVSTVVPRFMPRFARPADQARLLNLLRKAGLPDL